MSSKKEFDFQDVITGNRLKGLWSLLRGYRLPYILATISLGVAAASRSGIYLLLGDFTDQITTSSATAAPIPWIAGGFVGLAAVQGLFTFISGTLAARTSEGITRRLRNFLFDHIQRLSFAYHDRTNTGELIQRTTSDVDALRRFFADQAIGVGRIVMLFGVNIFFLILINTKLALLSVVVVPFTITLSIFFFHRVSQAYEEYQEQEARLSGRLQENLSGVRVVKAFARQQFEINKFDQENWKKFLKGKRLLTLHSLYWPISDILTGAQMLFGFYLGATMVIQETISLGMYLSYAGMIIWIIWPIRNMGRLIIQMSSGLVSFERIQKVIREEREPLTSGDYIPDTGRIQGKIKFDRVTFAYGSSKPVLHNITFQCKPGQIIALLGSTGSGKSTLVNLLPRFYEYSQGKLTLDGVDIKRYPRDFLRKHIGLVEQQPFLFSRSIRENITYGVDRVVTEQELVAASKAAAIHDVILSFSQQYDTIVGEKGVTLSGGQKQRVAIARTILKNPKILVLDDATSSVDVETEARIHSALEQLMRNRTTFIIAHRIQSLQRADKILILDKGRLVQQGTHNDLLSQPGKYREIFEIQSKIDDALQTDLDFHQLSPGQSAH